MIRAGVAALVGATLWASAGVAECRQALALGLDVSGSVDAREYRLQLDGVAGALDDPAVRAAVQRATFELLIGFQLTEQQLAYNATR